MPPDPEHRRGHRGGWGGRGWVSPGGSPPPWWPENEEWPPAPAAWRERRRRFARRAALGIVGVLVILFLLVGLVVWLVGTAAGSGWLGAVAAIGGVLLFAFLARSVVRGVRLATAPVGELIEAAGRVEDGELGIQVAERGPREVRALTRSFNAMSTRLARTEEQRRGLLADVSHELRTPLTVIQGNVEAMIDGLYPADREHLERIRAESAHLEGLIDDLRTLSLADAGALTLEREPTDLGAIAADVVRAFDARAAAGDVALTLAAVDDLPELELDARRIRQVIGNLVANALRHTPAGGHTVVSVRVESDAVILAVTDSGRGMPAEDVARAFERFWRKGEGQGAGLGLAIVRDLVAAHGGSVAMESAVGAGTTVTCRFPR
jgi:signal transduction histidine kinase